MPTNTHPAPAALPELPAPALDGRGLVPVMEVRDNDGRIQCVWLGYDVTDFVGQTLYATTSKKEAHRV